MRKKKYYVQEKSSIERAIIRLTIKNISAEHALTVS